MVCVDPRAGFVSCDTPTLLASTKWMAAAMLRLLHIDMPLNLAFHDRSV